MAASGLLPTPDGVVDGAVVEAHDQHLQLDLLVDSIREAESTDDLVESVARLARVLRDDIEQEEREYVTEKLLRDSVIPTDTFSG